MDTLETRWRRLEPHVAVHGPQDDRPRPAVLLFHGCGGVRTHLPLYAAAASDCGWRAFIVDSLAPRGLSRAFALAAVCTGAALRGHARAGDLLAAAHGVSRRPDVDGGRLAVAGWSHGGWTIMEALSGDPARPGAFGLKDAADAPFAAIEAAFLAYPYVGPAAPNRARPWRRVPRTLTVAARHDHLTTLGATRRVFDSACADDARLELWAVDATHAFDEPEATLPMRHDPALTETALRRFQALLTQQEGSR